MKKNYKILIADDDKQMLKTLKLLLKYEFSEIATISNPNLIPENITNEKYDVILLDMNFSIGKTSGNEGIFWLREILKTDPTATVVMISAYADINKAVEAIKEGAVDFILKPWENQKLIATLQSACILHRTKEELAKDKARNQLHQLDQHKSHELILGKSPKMQKVWDTIEMVSPTDANILILGENGTGKEVIARAIHQESMRNKDVFIHLDLGSVVETLFESELFGHTKGAFTGAIQNKKGRFELANSGTLFLDEIGNINMPLQGKLLSALETREIYSVGSQRQVPIDVRLICATNKNIHQMVKESKFREDLLYRINTIEISLPPLRERLDDLPELCSFFLTKYNHKYERECHLNNNIIDHLKKHNWPGNIRELQHTIEKAVILSTSDKLQIDDFGFGSKSESFDQSSLKSWMDIERFFLHKSIEKHKGNITEVAKELELSRPAIYRKMKKYGL